MDVTLAFGHHIDMTDDVPALRLALSFEEFYRAEYPGPVSYTHLTLPTSDLV